MTGNMKLKKGSKGTNKTNIANQTPEGLKLINLIIFIINIIVFVYITKLKYCEIDQKKNKQLKKLAIFSIITPFISLVVLLFGALLFKGSPMLLLTTYAIMIIGLTTVKGYYVTNFYKYVGKVDNTDCITDDIRGFHNFMLIWRIVAVILFTIQLLSLVIIASDIILGLMRKK